MFQSTLASSKEYKLFRSWVALQRVLTTEILGGELVETTWRFFDYGPRDAPPLVCLPGVLGQAESFFRQFVALCPKGYRLISVASPAVDNHAQWVRGFELFLDRVGLRTGVHILGVNLGGFLAQLYAQAQPRRVASLVLLNSFCDTTHFGISTPWSPMLRMMPDFLLQRQALAGLQRDSPDEGIKFAAEFLVEQTETMPGGELASRLSLCCSSANVDPAKVLPNERVTVITSHDPCIVPLSVREEVHKFYPDAKCAELKTGADYAHISRAEEVNMYLQVHMRAHAGLERATLESAGQTQTPPSQQQSSSPDKQQNP